MPTSSKSRRPREVGGYRLTRKLGEGSFGEVFQGRRNGKSVAVKLERLEKGRKARLLTEAGLVEQLRDCTGIPQVYWSGKLRKYNAMAMQLLGPSIENLFRKNKKKLSLRTVLQCCDQLIERLQKVHSRGLLHRDMKPQNFVVGRGSESSKVYLIDFGLSKTYLDARTGKHIPFRDGRTGLTGTARYTSINNHLGIEPTRRDDLEGLGYVVLHLLRGSLPWQSIKADTKQERNERIKQAKLRTTLEELCRGLPAELIEYMEVCRRIPFDGEPPYAALRALMRRAIERTPCKGAPDALDWGSATPQSSEASSSSSCTSSSEYSTSRSTSYTSSTVDTGREANRRKRKR